ncbi:hypothetical protein [Streptomyces natalensis]|uniref:Uncharacterized protein n=1 Tax=Streptomyces natalensis ATCC 27448 TaxID=1240678 RepID=A0A0D7CQA8_9ACTN|nr:hypothetical protein [Streptomyces natalensis]KIZ18055.1 hypothetical protein SNA_10345 [Streptomyces natalensis ATCC 27448]
MTHPIAKALEDTAGSISKAVAKDAAGAVGGLYRKTAHGAEQVAKNVAETEAKHSKSFSSLAKSGEKSGGGPKRRASRSSSGSDKGSPPPKRQRKDSKYPLPSNADRNPKQTATKVDPKTHDLAQKVNDRRKADSDRSKKNYAAFEWEDEHGQKHVEIGHSDGTHSERVIGVPVLDRQKRLAEEKENALTEGRDPGPDRKIKVTRIYSERDFCNQRSPNCNDWTRHYFPDAERSYAVEYDHHTPGSKKQGNRDLEDHIRWVFGDKPIKRRS